MIPIDNLGCQDRSLRNDGFNAAGLRFFVDPKVSRAR